MMAEVKRGLVAGVFFGLGAWVGLLAAGNGPDIYTRLLRKWRA